MNKNSIRYIVKNSEAIFTRLRWPHKITCPYCGETHIWQINSTGTTHYKCQKCNKVFTPYTNTIMHGSHLDTSAWLLTLYLMLDSRGISSVEVARKVGITQKTAWNIMMKWRLAMSQESVELNGVITMDETYWGGSWTNKTLAQQQALIDKFLPKKYCPRDLNEKAFFKVNAAIHTPIFAMNDGSSVILKVLPKGFDKTDLQDIFAKHSNNIEMCVSDCSKLYDDWDVPFEHNNHKHRQYKTKSGYSSNNIEGLFSHLKRALHHNQVHISNRFMQLYLDELSFRWRHRLDTLQVKMKDTAFNRRYDLQAIQELPSKEPAAIIPPTQIDNLGFVVDSIKSDGITYKM